MKLLLCCVRIIERSQRIMWTFMFHSGLRVFNDINKIVSIFSNAAFASKTYWNNTTFVKCTRWSFAEITVFRIFSIRILKHYLERNEASWYNVWKWRIGWIIVWDPKAFHLSEQKQNNILTSVDFVREPDTWCTSCCMKQGELLSFLPTSFILSGKVNFMYISSINS